MSLIQIGDGALHIDGGAGQLQAGFKLFVVGTQAGGQVAVAQPPRLVDERLHLGAQAQPFAGSGLGGACGTQLGSGCR